MVPAGLNHFIPLFPQPQGSGLSGEVFRALFDSHLFDVVKAVELIAGICVLTGWYTPLALVLCMPVSFCVFWWDNPISGNWLNLGGQAGQAVLFCNLALCLAYWDSYRAMFTLRAKPRTSGEPGAPAAAQPQGAWATNRLVLIGQLVFGAWMLASGANHFFVNLWPEPAGHEPLGIQLMTGLRDGWMLDVAMVIQLAAGALILTGFFVPVALCVVMPVSVCAAFWSVILERDPAGAALAAACVGLNGLLMLAYIDYYKGMLRERGSLAFGETEKGDAKFVSVFGNPTGRLSQGAFVGGLAVLLLTVAFYVLFAQVGRNRDWVLVALLFPGFVLLARRLHDMGKTAWFLLVPGAPVVAYAWLHLFLPRSDLTAPMGWTAAAAVAAFAVWALVGKGQAEGNRFEVPATA
jgi:uncharacterized membrane protein YhaH (DUF805 family)